MATAKKYKRLTNAEKKARKEIREAMRNKGIIPPVKPKLNRKKFLQEVKEEFNSLDGYSDLRYLYEAIAWMAPGNQVKGITSEQIGVLKMMKIAVDLKNYMEEKRKNGETTYNPLDLYKEVVDPILKL